MNRKFVIDNIQNKKTKETFESFTKPDNYLAVSGVSSFTGVSSIQFPTTNYTNVDNDNKPENKNKTENKTDEIIKTIIKKHQDVNGENFSVFVDNDNQLLESSIETKKEDDEPVSQYKLDGITQFYIGSLSIVGLYIIFRIMKPTFMRS